MRDIGLNPHTYIHTSDFLAGKVFSKITYRLSETLDSAVINHEVHGKHKKYGETVHNTIEVIYQSSFAACPPCTLIAD